MHNEDKAKHGGQAKKTEKVFHGVDNKGSFIKVLTLNFQKMSSQYKSDTEPVSNNLVDQSMHFAYLLQKRKK